MASYRYDPGGRLGLPQYAKAFADNEIDVGVLQQLTADDLKELGDLLKLLISSPANHESTASSTAELLVLAKNIRAALR